MLFVEMVPRYRIIREGLIRNGKGESSYRVNSSVRFAQATLDLTFLLGLPSAKAWRLRAPQITPPTPRAFRLCQKHFLPNNISGSVECAKIPSPCDCRNDLNSDHGTRTD